MAKEWKLSSFLLLAILFIYSTDPTCGKLIAYKERIYNLIKL